MYGCCSCYSFMSRKLDELIEGYKALGIFGFFVLVVIGLISLLKWLWTFAFARLPLLLVGLLIVAWVGKQLFPPEQRVATRLWNSMLTKRGKSHFLALEAHPYYFPDHFFNGNEMFLIELKIELKSIRITTWNSYRLNQADKLNGWEWIGKTYLSAAAFRARSYDKHNRQQPEVWSEWYAGLKLEADLEKRNGHWRLNPCDWQQIPVLDTSDVLA